MISFGLIYSLFILYREQNAAREIELEKIYVVLVSNPGKSLSQN